MLNQLLQPFQIGDIYISLTETNPASKFGGVWEKIEDAFLLASSDRYSVGSTGGEAEHTLTVSEMPSHNHIQPSRDTNMAESGVNIGLELMGNSSTKGWPSKSTGGSQAHNNMPPYLAVYMYKKVA